LVVALVLVVLVMGSVVLVVLASGEGCSVAGLTVDKSLLLDFLTVLAISWKLGSVGDIVVLSGAFKSASSLYDANIRNETCRRVVWCAYRQARIQRKAYVSS
jgi:hypothetical protein